MGLRFRTAQLAESATIEDLLRAAFAPYARKLGREVPPHAYAWLRDSVARGDVYVGVDRDVVVGVVATRESPPGTLVIDRIAVTPERQGQGFGRWLLAAVEDAARARRCQILALHTAEIMMALLQFYLRAGFREVGRALPTHGKDDHLRVHFEKDLKASG